MLCKNRIQLFAVFASCASEKLLLRGLYNQILFVFSFQEIKWDQCRFMVVIHCWKILQGDIHKKADCGLISRQILGASLLLCSQSSTEFQVPQRCHCVQNMCSSKLTCCYALYALTITFDAAITVRYNIKDCSDWRYRTGMISAYSMVKGTSESDRVFSKELVLPLEFDSVLAKS